jgi:NAD(P)-dependent dehydrogenase (short-subunit alcohol dehydrogenase family)
VAGLSRRDSPGADRSILADVGDRDAVARAFDAMDPPDLVVHAAATIEPVAHIAEADPDTWAANVRTNVLGTFFVVQSAIRRMLPGSGGRIVALTSGAAARAKPWWSAYSASKAAVEHLVRSAAADLDGSVLAVCALDPGITETPMQELVRATAFPDRERFVRAHEEGEARDPSDVARAVLRLVERPVTELNGRVFRVEEA